MDDYVAIEMRTGVAYKASHGFGSVVPFHRGAIGEALKGRKHALVICRLRNEIADGLRLCFADRLDDGQQCTTHDTLCIRARANNRSDREHRKPLFESLTKSKIKTNATPEIQQTTPSGAGSLSQQSAHNIRFGQFDKWTVRQHRLNHCVPPSGLPTETADRIRKTKLGRQVFASVGPPQAPNSAFEPALPILERAGTCSAGAVNDLSVWYWRRRRELVAADRRRRPSSTGKEHLHDVSELSRRRRQIDLREVAAELGMSFSDDDLMQHLAALLPSIAAYNIIDRMPDEKPRGTYPRTAGYRPSAEENAHGAWYIKTTVEGAASGKLKGKKVVLKDNVCLAGVPMMNGASTLQGYVPDVDATVATRILDAGGTILGKAVCEYFCFSGGSHTSSSGPVHNPHRMGYSAGGSSSGSGCLVALGEVRHGPGRRPGRLDPHSGRILRHLRHEADARARALHRCHADRADNRSHRSHDRDGRGQCAAA